MPVKEKESKMEKMLAQILSNQESARVEAKATLTLHDTAIKNLEVQIGQLASQMNAMSRSNIPNDTIPNPKRDVINEEIVVEECDNLKKNQEEKKNKDKAKKYVYLEANNTLPVIIAADLNAQQEEQLVEVLKAHKKAIGWTIADIKDFSQVEKPSIPIQESRVNLEEVIAKLVESRIKNSQEQAAINVRINSSLKNLKVQMGQIATVVTILHKEGLPSNTETNLCREGNEECKEINLRSRKQLSKISPPTSESTPKLEVDQIEQEVSSTPTKAKVVIVEDDIEKESLKEAMITSKMKGPTSDHLSWMLPLPFPQRFQKKALKDQYKKFLGIFKQLHIYIPLIDALEQMLEYAKFLKEMLSKKRRLSECELVTLTEEYNAILLKKLPPKCHDLGSFSIPCVIGDKFQGEFKTLPVIISYALFDDQKERLLKVLLDHKQALGRTIAVIKGYNQIAIAPDDQEKTTFTYPYGTFAFRRMPFSLCNAPTTFQRCMMSIFSHMIEEIMEVICDASDFAVRAVLGQRQEKIFHPIYYASKTLASAQADKYMEARGFWRKNKGKSSREERRRVLYDKASDFEAKGDILD
ncbi:uncharacterized protein LOC129286499 [Prosopis cineraria]|uniref:uncharacterized protein LOC129286499 n=1 Tax=Prosopis cineraria TaxID=364024 RepID=UPI00240F4E7D|nr:uncharacterized protein LOC129286499 [Prosopis cineraria]